MNVVIDFVNTYLRLPSISWTDVVDVVILTFIIYIVLRWVKDTRAWSLLRGAAFILVFIILAYALQLNTVTWLISNFASVGLVGLVIIFQPELRRSLEELGRRGMFTFLSSSETRSESGFSEHTATEIVEACVEMSRAKTGALIVIEQESPLRDYERTGIDIDGVVSSQLLVNIFEKNTPLHDGAVIIKGDRVTSATCYLPLSDNMEIGKDLGTRHRAGLGMSEVNDSLVLIVSEETGSISIASGGHLTRDVSQSELKNRLMKLKKEDTAGGFGHRLLKGLQKNEEKADK